MSYVMREGVAPGLSRLVVFSWATALELFCCHSWSDSCGIVGYGHVDPVILRLGISCKLGERSR